MEHWNVGQKSTSSADLVDGNIVCAVESVEVYVVLFRQKGSFDDDSGCCFGRTSILERGHDDRRSSSTTDYVQDVFK